jgi:hypothetical protein
MDLNSCRCNKMKFSSKAEAKRYTREIKHSSNRSGSENLRAQNPYRCDHARMEVWHLTSQSKPEMRRYRKARGLA